MSDKCWLLVMDRSVHTPAVEVIREYWSRDECTEYWSPDRWKAHEFPTEESARIVLRRYELSEGAALNSLRVELKVIEETPCRRVAPWPEPRKPGALAPGNRAWVVLADSLHHGAPETGYVQGYVPRLTITNHLADATMYSSEDSVEQVLRHMRKVSPADWRSVELVRADAAAAGPAPEKPEREWVLRWDHGHGKSSWIPKGTETELFWTNNLANAMCFDSEQAANAYRSKLARAADGLTGNGQMRSAAQLVALMLKVEEIERAVKVK